jgi:hypothetical protein
VLDTEDQTNTGCIRPQAVYEVLMTDTPANIVPIQPLTEEAALAWLRSQPTGRTDLPNTEIGRRWGWPEHRVRRRLNAWQKAGLVRRRGRAITAVEIVGSGVGSTADPTLNPTPDPTLDPTPQAIDVPHETPVVTPVGFTRSLAVTNAARAAGEAVTIGTSIPAGSDAYPARLMDYWSGLERQDEPSVKDRSGRAGTASRSWWSAAGRGLVGLLLAGCGIAIAVTSIRANNWFGRSLSTDPTAQEIFSNLSVLAEIAACIIPTAVRFYWQDGDWRTAFKGYLLMVVALTVVFFASSGFVLNTISTGVELRSDRITPAVELAQRTADTLAKSRAAECGQRGPRCRALEAQERQALADLAAARAEVRAQADPQAQILHTNSNSVRTVQAGSMVALCLCAGYLISLGAGLLFKRNA